MDKVGLCPPIDSSHRLKRKAPHRKRRLTYRHNPDSEIAPKYAFIEPVEGGEVSDARSLRGGERTSQTRLKSIMYSTHFGSECGKVWFIWKSSRV